MKLPLIIGIIIYIVGFIITILICRKLSADDEETIVSAWMWPFVFVAVLAWVIINIPLYLCKLVDAIIDKFTKEEE